MNWEPLFTTNKLLALYTKHNYKSVNKTLRYLNKKKAIEIN